MDTDARKQATDILARLQASDWTVVLGAIKSCEAWIGSANPGDPAIANMLAELASLARHPKWEIRYAVAAAAGRAPQPVFDTPLSRLSTDDNMRVRQAANQAALRRRDWRNASALGRQHEERINTTLDEIEAHYGVRGREAVKRASEQIANTFARELYHEIIRLISPIVASTERLTTQLGARQIKPEELSSEATRIGRRVEHLRAVLDAMRAYTAQPKLTFTDESLRALIDDAVSLARDSVSIPEPFFIIEMDQPIQVEVAGARVVQALVNVLTNAVESYAGLVDARPVVIHAEAKNGWVTIEVRDSGAGMDEEALKDSTVLFVTNKPRGTGFGLPLAIKIVEDEHRGRLRLESIKGRGTTVRINLPQQRADESVA